MSCYGNEMLPEEGCRQALTAGREAASWLEVIPDKGWKLTLQECGNNAVPRTLSWNLLQDVTSPENLPDFSGVMEYETFFDSPCEGEMWVEIDCGEVGECMEVWLNGNSMGVRIAPPYRVRGKGKLFREDNLLQVRVVNTLVHQQRDYFSRSLPLEPSGLLGPVKLRIVSGASQGK